MTIHAFCSAKTRAATKGTTGKRMSRPRHALLAALAAAALFFGFQRGFYPSLSHVLSCSEWNVGPAQCLCEPKQASTEPQEASAFRKVTHPANMHLYIHVRLRRKTPSMAVVRPVTGIRTSVQRLPRSSVCRGKNLRNKTDPNKVIDDRIPQQEGGTPEAE